MWYSKYHGLPLGLANDLPMLWAKGDQQKEELRDSSMEHRRSSDSGWVTASRADRSEGVHKKTKLIQGADSAMLNPSTNPNPCLIAHAPPPGTWQYIQYILYYVNSMWITLSNFKLIQERNMSCEFNDNVCSYFKYHEHMLRNIIHRLLATEQMHQLCGLNDEQHMYLWLKFLIFQVPSFQNWPRAHLISCPMGTKETHKWSTHSMKVTTLLHPVLTIRKWALPPFLLHYRMLSWQKILFYSLHLNLLIGAEYPSATGLPNCSFLAL
jgi:hypothetical protein